MDTDDRCNIGPHHQVKRKSILKKQTKESAMTIQEIMNAIRDMKGEYQNGNINSEELMEAMDDLLLDVEGTDAYSGFGTSMEDDGFYDDLPDFTALVVD